MSGYSKHSRDRDVVVNLALLDTASATGDELIAQLQRFWDTEAIGIVEDSQTRDSSLCSLIKFNSTDKRYVATNYEICLTRLHQLRIRLQRDKSLLQQYQSTFDQQLQSGIIELVPEAKWVIANCFFLPHHGVVRQEKQTTKLCIVFDGSAKSDDNVSLNDRVQTRHHWFLTYC